MVVVISISCCLCFTRLIVIQLVPLCDGLKRQGHLLEADHGEKLDTLQMFLTEICKDPGVDVTLRLKVLELIELRSLGWNSSPGMESFYREKISKFEKKDDSSPDSSSVGKQATPGVPGGDNLRSISQAEVSVGNLLPDRKKQQEECLEVNVDGEIVKLVISSSCSELNKYAKMILFQQFTSSSSSSSSGSSIGPGVLYSRFTGSSSGRVTGSSSGFSIGPGVQYSREELLSMARSPTAREKPEDWDSVLANIPEITRKP